MSDRRFFHVRDVLNLSEWNEVEAELLVRTPLVQFWMEVEEVEALRERGLLQSILDSVVKRTVRRTPTGSVDSDRGIVPIEHAYFGQSPNVDGDGRTDVLLLDIEDRFEETGSFVSGFFDPVDLTTQEHSNRRDLLYVDTRPTIFYRDSVATRRAAATIAHEYQHLIHANYEGETRERTFINEGGSELAEMLCGFPARSPRAFVQSAPRSLLSWDRDRPLPDYARASLWTRYLFGRIGIEHASTLVQSKKVGLEGIRYTLQTASAPDFATLFQDWGRTLLLGKQPPPIEAIGLETDAIQLSPSETLPLLPRTTTIRLPPLSHAIVEFPLTSSLTVKAGKVGADLRLAARATYPGGLTHFTESKSLPVTVRADRNSYGSLSTLVSNTSTAQVDSSDFVQLLAHGETSAQEIRLKYDDGTSDPFSGRSSYLLLDDPGESVALAFGLPESGWLSAVSLKAIFQSEVAGSTVPTNAPRTVSLRVREFEDGKVGPALTPPVTRALNRPLGNLELTRINLDSLYRDLASVSDSVAVVLRSGSESNPLAVAMDRKEKAKSSHAFYKAADQAWRPMETVRIGSSTLQNHRPLVRAHLAVSPKTLTASRIQGTFEYDHEHTYFKLQAPFPLDSVRTSVVAAMPSDSVVTAHRLTDAATTPFGVTTSQERVYELPLEVGATYRVHVRAAADGQPEYGQRSFTWSVPKRKGVQMGTPYPSPAQTQTRVRVLLLEEATVSGGLYDVLGRRVRDFPERRFEAGSRILPLSLRGLSAGAYFIRLSVQRDRDGARFYRTRKIIHVQ